MKAYIDFYIKPMRQSEIEKMFARLKGLGYAKVGVDSSLYNKINIKKIGEKYGVRVFWINLIEATNRREAARKLSMIEKTPNALNLIHARGVDAARYAGTSKKLAGMLLEPGYEKFVDKSTAKLFRDRGWGIIVIPLKYLLGAPKSRRIWRFYYLSLRRAYAYNINISLASAASTPEELWHPYSAAGVASLFGVPGEFARLWLSSSPQGLLSILHIS